MGISENKTPLIVALYARVSSSNQEVQQTIQSQLDEIKSRIEADGNILPKQNIFIDDGWTGEMLQRPSLDLMRDGAKTGNFKALYVYDRGRLSRIFFHQEIVLEELRDKDVEFISLHDVKAITPEEQVLQSMQGVFHQYERIKIIERFRRGKLYKAKQGIIINGDALYGYSYIKKTDKSPTSYQINEKEAEIVRKIFRWVGVEGLSMRGVIMKLYRMGVYPKKRKKDTWSKGPIVRMLKNRSYIDGIAFYNKSEAIVSKNPINKEKYKRVKRTSRRVRPTEDWIPFEIPKLIEDKSLFDKVQKILEDNKRYASKNRKYDYLLTGKTYCEHGFRRVGDGYSKGQNHYYRSAARIYEYPKETKCDCMGVNAVVLDGLFWDKLHKILINPVLLRKLAEKWFKERDNYSTSSVDEVANLKKQIDNLRGEEVKYAKMYGEGIVDSSQFEELMRGVKTKKRRYQDEIEEIKNKSNSENSADVSLIELCKEAESVIKSQDTTDRKQVVRELVDKIIIKKGGDEVETWIHIPLNQAHLMGYGAKRRSCWPSKCR